MIYPPQAPSTVASRNDATTTSTTLGVLLTALTGTDTGGSSILSYHLDYEVSGTGAGPWIEVSGSSSDVSTTTRTISSLT